MAEKKTTTSNDVRKVKIKLPRAKGYNAEQQIVVSVNFVNYIIKLGEWVEVPYFVASAIEDAQKAEEEADIYAESIARREA